MNFLRKYLLPILLVFCLSNTSLFAQGSKVNIGLIAGMNASSFTKQKSDSVNGFKFGYSAGAFINCSVRDFMNVQLELLYMQQGGVNYSKDSLSDHTEKSINHISLHNFEIPLLFKFGIPGSASTVHPRVFLGPALGINIFSTNNYVSAITFPSGRKYIIEDKDDVTADYTQLQWGAYFGIGGDIEMGSCLMAVDLRYRLGLNALATNNNVDILATEVKSNTIALTIALSLKK